MDEGWLGSSCSMVVAKDIKAELESVIISKGTGKFNGVELWYGKIPSWNCTSLEIKTLCVARFITL